MGKLLSAGNHKLAKEILVWNLNRKQTCPGQTEWCDKHCYEKKAYRYPDVRPSRNKKLVLSTKDEFIKAVVEEIKRKRNPVLGLRIHGGGDFYSQEYINKWFEIIREFPEIAFKANTRSWMYDYTGKPENLKLRYSVDNTTSLRSIEVMRPQVDGFAFIEGSQPEGTKECRDQVDGFGCGFTGRDCSYCYTESGDVWYHIH